MVPIDGTGANALCILLILKEYSDFDHPLTQQDIISKMKNEFGISIARNAVSRNLSILEQLGYRLSTRGDSRRGIYLSDREFTESETISLMDSVLSSRYIPENDAKSLIEKLSHLQPVHFRKRVPKVYTVSSFSHQRDTQFYYNLEILNECVSERIQVAFMYNRPQEDGKLHHVKTHREIVHPYALLCANSQYYLVCSNKNYNNLLHYRVDRITDIEPLGDRARDIREIPEAKNGFNAGEYSGKHIMMFSGKTQAIVFKIRRDMLPEVFDTFDIASARIQKIDDEYTKVTVFATPLGVKYWAMQFGDVCEVLSPQSLRDDILNMARNMAEKYSG